MALIKREHLGLPYGELRQSFGLFLATAMPNLLAELLTVNTINAFHQNLCNEKKFMENINNL